MKKDRIKIMLVDDDELIRLYFKDIFWIHGLDKNYEIFTVGSPKKAEEMIRNPLTRPEIIFLDLIMPYGEGGMKSSWKTGIDLLKKIKKDPKLKNIKVVVYTGLKDNFISDEAKKLGAEMYIIKGENLPKDFIEIAGRLSKKIDQKRVKKICQRQL